MKQIFLILTLCLPTYLYCQCNFDDQMSRPPEELNRRHLNDIHDNKVPGFRYGHPYTMFVKGNEFNLLSTLQKIRDNIRLGQPFKNDVNLNTNDYSILYKEIWEATNGDNIYEPNACDDADACPHPAWVKNNAIIYLIGLKVVTVGLTFHFDSMTNSERAAFGLKANNGLKGINPVVTSCNGGSDCGKLRRRAFQLIQYLQSYDILKTGGYISADINRLKCNPRNKLREFTKNIYVESNFVINSNTGWKKNHGIICASALGMSSLVLNDAGVELSYGQFFFGWLTGKGTNWPRPNYSPLNWYDRANGNGGYNSIIGEAGIEDNFFVGKHGAFWHDVPQSSPDGKSGYAEGVGYYTDLAQAYFCFLRATDNALPTWNGKDYLGQGKYQNMLNWYRDILNHDNSCPTYDNTNLQAGNLLGVLGMKEYPGDGKFVSSLAQTSKMDLR